MAKNKRAGKKIDWTLASLEIIFTLCVIIVIVVFGFLFMNIDTRTDIERANDALSTYELCTDADNSHEVCLLQAIEAYN